MSPTTMTTEEAKKAKINELLDKLSTNKKGLSSSEAKERIQQYGPNEIHEKKVNPIVKFLGYFWGPIPWMIEAAVIMSAYIRHWPDFAFILMLLMLNAVVGFWQEHKADNAIELLKQKLAPSARVLRDAKWVQLPAREIVPGDVVRVRLGDIVPADIKLMEGGYLQVDESALTGESLPVEKHVSDVAYGGSIIRQGEMDALVATTGMSTFFGKTAKLVQEAKTKSHFQKAITKIGDYLIVLAITLVMVILIVSLIRHESLPETIQFALVLTVAAIPAALPAVLSVTMAIGAIALAKKEAIVSKLVSIEEMAGVDLLCSDKTGTITKNELCVAEVKALGKFKDSDVLLFGALASREENKDPIDSAIIDSTKASKDITKTIGAYKAVKFKPFDPVSKRTEATIEGARGKRFKVAKGAPQVILSLVASKGAIKAEVDKSVDAFAVKAYRALGVAKSNKGKWQYVGLIALYDPPREDSAETIKTAQSMGVQVKMVTGDHVAIAKEIAKEVNLGTNIAQASSFVDKPDSEAKAVVEKADGFAQVFPEHKFQIVKLLQSEGHIVGMTGDGVNDAPALKQADAGIAVAGSTDAAKSAASIVLTKPGLSVIIDAIKQSRMIFQRMTNYAIYRIAETFRVLFFITLTILLFQIYPVTALMIVLLAILNDLPIITISYDNVIYSRSPERWNMRMILTIASILGTLGVIESLGVFYLGHNLLHLNPENVLKSFIYLKLSVAGHLTVFMARTKGHFWELKPAKPLFLAVVSTQLTATLITVYGILLPAMGWGYALIIWGEAFTVFVIIDLIKVHVYQRLGWAS